MKTKPLVRYNINAQKRSGYFAQILTSDVLEDICFKATGCREFEVVTESESYNKGRLVTIEYNNVLYYVTLSAEKAHGIVVMHIYSDSASADNWSSNITDFATNLQTLLGALNSRSSVTLNGHTYNFSGATQKVSAILCGHTHYDYVDSSGNVPVIAITQTFPTYNSTTYSVDAIVIDYDANEMRCTRLGGEGSDRTVTIVT